MACPAQAQPRMADGEKQTIICAEADCGRKANNLCPNSRCLNHCHEYTEANGNSNCKRHEREWENKQRLNRSNTVSGAERSRPARTGTAVAPSKGTKRPSSSQLRESSSGAPDPFFLLPPQTGARAPYQLRKCPSCDKLIPCVGSFFWLHLSQCDSANFHEYVEGLRSLPRLVYDESYERRKDPGTICRRIPSAR